MARKSENKEVVVKSQEVVAAPAVETGHAYFDLRDYIEGISSYTLAANIATGVVYALDREITSTINGMVKSFLERRGEFDVETTRDMLTMLEDEAFGEQLLSDSGVPEAGMVRRVQEAKAIRESWLELAKERTALTLNWDGTPRELKMMSIEEKLVREIKMEVSEDTKRRIKLSVKILTEDEDLTPEEIEEIVAMQEAKEAKKMEDISKALMERQGAAATLYSVIDSGSIPSVANYNLEGEVHFHELDVNLRRKLLMATKESAKKAVEWATSSKNISELEFVQTVAGAKKVTKQIDAILLGSAYAQQRAMELAV